MVWAGARFGEAEGDVHGGVEVEQFERDEALVVIHGDDGVEMALCGVAENGIGDGGAGECGEASGVEAEDGGLDDGFFLGSKSAVFAGVRVESGDGDARVCDATAQEEFCGEAADFNNAVGSEEFGDFCEWLVDGGEAYGESVAGEEHAEV